MPNLDIYKGRKFNTVAFGDKVFKIPTEYTVEEVERLLELDTKRKSVQNEVVENQEEQLKTFWELVFNQLEIIFQHYQPEMIVDDLRVIVSHNEALGILGFFDEYRNKLKEQSESKETTEDNKKKTLK